jgi:hypothetical protein
MQQHREGPQQRYHAQLRSAERMQRRRERDGYITVIEHKLVASKNIVEAMKKKIKQGRKKQNERQQERWFQSEREFQREVIGGAAFDYKLMQQLIKAPDDNARNSAMQKIKKRMHELQQEEATDWEKSDTVLKELHEPDTFWDQVKDKFGNERSFMNKEIIRGVTWKTVAMASIAGVIAVGVGHVAIPFLVRTLTPETLANPSFVQAMTITGLKSETEAAPNNTLIAFFFIMKTANTLSSFGVGSAVMQASIGGAGHIVGVLLQGHVTPQIVDYLQNNYGHIDVMCNNLGLKVVGAFTGMASYQLASTATIRILSATFKYNYDEVTQRDQKIQELAEQQEKIDFLNDRIAGDMTYDKALEAWNSSLNMNWRKASSASAAVFAVGSIIGIKALSSKNPGLWLTRGTRAILESKYGQLLAGGLFQHNITKLSKMVLPIDSVLKWAVNGVANKTRKLILSTRLLSKETRNMLRHDDYPLVLAHFLKPTLRRKLMRNTVTRFIITSSMYNAHIMLASMTGNAITGTLTNTVVGSPIETMNAWTKAVEGQFEVSEAFDAAYNQAVQDGKVDAFISERIEAGLKVNFSEFTQLLKVSNPELRKPLWDNFLGISSTKESIVNSAVGFKETITNLGSYVTDRNRWDRFYENAVNVAAMNSFTRKMTDLQQKVASHGDNTKIASAFETLERLKTLGVFTVNEQHIVTLADGFGSSEPDGAAQQIGGFYKQFNSLNQNLEKIGKTSLAAALPDGSSVETIQESTKKINESITTIETTEEEIDQAYTGLQDMIKEDTSFLTNIQQLSGQTDEKIKEANSKAGMLQFEYSSVLADITKIESTKTEIQQLLDKLGKFKSVEKVDDVYNALTKHYSKLEKWKQTLDTNMGTVTNVLSGKIINVVELEKNVKNAQGAMQSIDGILGNFQQQQKTISEVMVKAEAAYNEQNEVLTSQHNELNKIQNDLKDKFKALAEQNKNYHELFNKLRTEETELRLAMENTRDKEREMLAGQLAIIRKARGEVVGKIDTILAQQKAVSDSLEKLSNLNDLTAKEVQDLFEQYKKHDLLKETGDILNTLEQDFEKLGEGMSTAQNIRQEQQQKAEEQRARESIAKTFEELNKDAQKLRDLGVSEAALQAYATKLGLDQKHVPHLQEYLNGNVHEGNVEAIKTALNEFKTKIDEKVGRPGAGDCMITMSDDPKCMMRSASAVMADIGLKYLNPMAAPAYILGNTIEIGGNLLGLDNTAQGRHLMDITTEALSMGNEITDALRGGTSTMHVGQLLAKVIIDVGKKAPVSDTNVGEEVRQQTGNLRRKADDDVEEAVSEYIKQVSDQNGSKWDAAKRIYSNLKNSEAIEYAFYGRNPSFASQIPRALANQFDALVMKPTQLFQEGKYVESGVAAIPAVISGTVFAATAFASLVFAPIAVSTAALLSVGAVAGVGGAMGAAWHAENAGI